jgi:hypothetical protein
VEKLLRLRGLALVDLVIAELREAPNAPTNEKRDLPETRRSRHTRRADTRTRTGDPFITSEVLYQLSYVGVLRRKA